MYGMSLKRVGHAIVEESQKCVGEYAGYPRRARQLLTMEYVSRVIRGPLADDVLDDPRLMWSKNDLLKSSWRRYVDWERIKSSGGVASVLGDYENVNDVLDQHLAKYQSKDYAVEKTGSSCQSPLVEKEVSRIELKEKRRNDQVFSLIQLAQEGFDLEVTTVAPDANENESEKSSSGRLVTMEDMKQVSEQMLVESTPAERLFSTATSVSDNETIAGSEAAQVKKTFSKDTNSAPAKPVYDVATSSVTAVEPFDVDEAVEKQMAMMETPDPADSLCYVVNAHSGMAFDGEPLVMEMPSAAEGEIPVMDSEAFANNYEMSSVLKKRRLKMNKHKHKKMLKKTRSLRKRLGKIK